MSKRDREFPEDRTAGQRRKDLTEEEVRELELAGGVEGGMRAGSAGGPGEGDARPKSSGERRPKD